MHKRILRYHHIMAKPVSFIYNNSVPSKSGLSSAFINKYSSSLSSSEDSMYDINSYFPGASAKFSCILDFTNPEEYDSIPIFRVMSKKGEIFNQEEAPHLDKELGLKMYKMMTLLSTMDHILWQAEKDGRIDFYITNEGEEAIHMGSAAAIHHQDLVFGQYRECGVLMWRGFPVESFIDQCLSNVDDLNKGRQMPVFYGSADLNYVTLSPTLATQMPQAAGAAYAYKRAQNGLCVVCYFGEGTASEGDAHVAFNFAATLEAPVLFICRNNGFAISTPTAEQYKGDGIAGRGPCYGLPTVRVDGNDILAVYKATKAARDIVVKEGKAVLVEAMTYRVGDHTSLVDGVGYRERKTKYWVQEAHPIGRLKYYLAERGWWSEEQDEEWIQLCHNQVNEALERSEKKIKPNPELMFTDVYKELPAHLKKQMKAMKDHILKYKEHYPLDQYEKWL